MARGGDSLTCLLSLFLPVSVCALYRLPCHTYLHHSLPPPPLHTHTPITPTTTTAVLRVFAKDSSLPSLVHCAHGKDRTGVIIMLLLLICDTPHEAIVADYVQVGEEV